MRSNRKTDLLSANFDFNSDLIFGDEYLQEKRQAQTSDNNFSEPNLEEAADFLIKAALLRIVQLPRTVLSSMSVARVFRLSARDKSNALLTNERFSSNHAWQNHRIAMEEDFFAPPNTQSSNRQISHSQQAIQDYKAAFANWRNMSPEYKKTQVANMYKIQMKGVLIPSAISEYLAKKFELSSESAASLNALFAGGLFRDNAARFHAINAYGNDPKDLNLFTIKKEDYSGNYEKLQRRIKVYNNNLSDQRKILGLKNVLFSGSAYLSRPIAESMVVQMEDDIEKKSAENMVTYLIRSGFAVPINIADRLLTLLSVGNKENEVVRNEFWQDLKSGKFRKLSAGGSAGILNSLIKATVIADGPTYVKNLYKNIDELLGSFSEEKDAAKPSVSVASAEAKKVKITQQSREKD